MVDVATGQAQDNLPDEGKNPAAVALGSLGGLKGGNARAKALSASKRSSIAKKAAQCCLTDIFGTRLRDVEAKTISLVGVCGVHICCVCRLPSLSFAFESLMVRTHFKKPMGHIRK